jgi:glycerol-3-phosphate O-acyltransferase
MAIATWIEISIVLVVLALLVSALANRHARRLIRERRLRVDRFKTRRKHTEIRLEVFGSPIVVEAVKQYARDHHVSLEAAERQARIYLMEIVPKFNLLAYYRFGGPIARAFLHLLYWVVVDRATIERFNEKIPKDAVVIYMINHRSNADYVLVAHMLYKFISLSYAVGEWARVWPLNHLFKWFGGYFIRRRYREPLYHAVLSQFVATITRSGVTQGVFLEGGLTRDGAYRKPKLGMLDYIVQSKRDDRFSGPLYFVPTAVAYDRVLEDRNLTDELKGREDRRGRFAKLASTFDYLFRNFWRGVFRRFRRYGFAMVAFGEPLSVDEFIRKRPDVLAANFAARKPHLRVLAEETMRRIAAAMPVTPVAVVASVLGPHEWLTESEAIDAIEKETARLDGRVFLRSFSAREIWDEAIEVLSLRRLVEEDGMRWRWAPEEEILRRYYANGLLTFDEVSARGWEWA